MIGRLRAAISRQLANPQGTGGKVIAVLMNRGNRDLNARAIALLDVRPDARVLDLGFGGGATLPGLLDRAATVAAVDRAADMVQAAAARHPDAIADARLTVRAGEADAIPLQDAAVDRVLTVNTIYFWRDLQVVLAEIRRVLAPGGRLVIGIRDGSVMEQVDPAIFTVRTPAEIARELVAAGFGEPEIRRAPDGATHLIAAQTAAISAINRPSSGA